MPVASPELKRRMQDFTAACRHAGLKLTHQRTEVFRELAKSDKHPDAETIHRRVRRRIPAVSLDTVYRSLILFEKLRLVHRVSALSPRARFDADGNPHQHFICSECGLVRDFHSSHVNAFKPPRKIRTWGDIYSVHLEARGLCAACLQRKEESA